jgi:hypothetical protein
LPEPFRRRDDGVDGLVASFLAATAIASTRSSGRKVRPTVFDSPMASAAFVSFTSAHVAHRLNVPWEMDTRSKAGHCVCSAPHRYTELERAEERTRTADPISLRVIGQALQGFAGDCKSRIFRGVSFLRLAECCTVLRSRWYQSGINGGIAASRSCSVVALTCRTSSISRDRLESSLCSAATLAGCLRWALPPPTAWTGRWASATALTGERRS